MLSKTYKRVTLVTDMDFWRPGSGARARSFKMIEALSRATILTVISTLPAQAADDILIKRLKLPFKHNWLNPQQKPSQAEQINVLRPLISEEDVIIFRTIKNSFLRAAVSIKNKTYIDVDDLESEYCESITSIGNPPEVAISFAAENKIYSHFDKIICIQAEHVAKMNNFHPLEKLLLTPHPIKARLPHFNQQATRIGFFASGWHANVEGINWFLKNVWQSLSQQNFTLDIYGYICSELSLGDTLKRVRLMGAVSCIDDVYNNIDIAINPVRYGSGLKIKTLEALGHGIPVISSREGARGLLYLHNKALLVCDSEQEFITSLQLISSNTELRKAMSRYGYSHIKETFNEECCFASLIEDINSIAQFSP